MSNLNEILKDLLYESCEDFLPIKKWLEDPVRFGKPEKHEKAAIRVNSAIATAEKQIEQLHRERVEQLKNKVKNAARWARERREYLCQGGESLMKSDEKSKGTFLHIFQHLETALAEPEEATNDNT